MTGHANRWPQGGVCTHEDHAAADMSPVRKTPLAARGLQVCADQGGEPGRREEEKEAQGEMIGSTAATLGSDERVEFHLQNWAQWQKTGGVVGMYGGSGSPDYCQSIDFDDMCDSMDRRNAKTLDAWIQDLPALQRLAIYNAYLHSVYRLRGQRPSEEHLLSAKFVIGKKLVKWGLY